MTSASLRLILLLIFGSTPYTNTFATFTPDRNSVDAQVLAREIHRGRNSITEFAYISEICRELKVRCWLFGGTATAFGQHTKNKIIRNQHPDWFRAGANRFDDVLPNLIIRNQDLDIVTDASSRVAEEITDRVRHKFPLTFMDKGSSAWEVRPLASSIGLKEAILGNPNFINQHSDSMSNGLIELTEPPPGESVIRDIRKWEESRKATFQGIPFLDDLSRGKITLYFSPNHAQTTLAKAGRNPPIREAIRLLTKAFQYNLEISAEDKRVLQGIVQSFEPRTITSSERDWIEASALKMIVNSQNYERTINILDELGLRPKLLALGDATRVGSLSWRLSKEPLRSKPVGAGTGRTASELGISKLNHQLKSLTKELDILEVASRALDGRTNFAISRASGASSEVAVWGKGLYTSIGDSLYYQKNGGHAIHLELDPNAREGSDFMLIKDPKYPNVVVVKNNEAVRILPSSVDLSFSQLLTAASETDFRANAFYLEQNANRLRSSYPSLQVSEVDTVAQRLLPNIPRMSEEQRLFTLRELLLIPAATKSKAVSQIVEAALEASPYAISEVLPQLFQESSWITTRAIDPLIEKLLKDAELGRENSRYLVTALFQLMGNEDIIRHPQFNTWLERCTKLSGANQGFLISSLLVKSSYRHSPAAAATLVKILNNNPEIPFGDTIVHSLLKEPEWQNRPETFEAVRRTIRAAPRRYDKFALMDVMIQPGFRTRAKEVWETLRLHISLADSSFRRGNALDFLQDVAWQKDPEALEMLHWFLKQPSDINEYWSVDDKLKEVLSFPFWRDHPELRKITGGATPTLEALRNGLSQNVTAIRILDKSRVELKLGDKWKDSGLLPPPNGISYEHAFMDAKGNVFVTLGENTKGVNFISADRKTVVVASRFRWKDELIPPALKSIHPNPTGAGIVGMDHEGTVWFLTPPSQPQGEFAAIPLTNAGDVREIRTNISDGRTFVEFNTGSSQELRAFMKSRAPASTLSNCVVRELSTVLHESAGRGID